MEKSLENAFTYPVCFSFDLQPFFEIRYSLVIDLFVFRSIFGMAWNLTWSVVWSLRNPFLSFNFRLQKNLFMAFSNFVKETLPVNPSINHFQFLEFIHLLLIIIHMNVHRLANFSISLWVFERAKAALFSEFPHNLVIRTTWLLKASPLAHIAIKWECRVCKNLTQFGVY